MIKELLIVGSIVGGCNTFSTPAPQVFSVTNEVYTYIEGDKSYELTLLDDNNYNLVIYTGETINATINGTYIENENNSIELYVDGELLYSVYVNDENLTFSLTPLNPPIEDIKEVYFFDVLDVEGGSVSLEFSREVDGVEEIVESGYQKGDKVKLTLDASVFYRIDNINVKVNETTLSLEHIENTIEWSFYLNEEGTYTITPSFVVDNELFQKFLDLYNDFKTGDLGQIFSIQNITFVAMTLFYLIYFIVKIAGDRKFKKNVISDVCTTFGLDKNSTPTQIVNQVTEKSVVPIMKDVKKSQDKNNQIIKTLTLALLYIQENTPEARERVVKLIGKLENMDDEVNDVVQEVLKVLKNEADEKTKQEQENKETLTKVQEDAKKVIEETDYRPTD